MSPPHFPRQNCAHGFGQGNTSLPLSKGQVHPDFFLFSHTVKIFMKNFTLRVNHRHDVPLSHFCSAFSFLFCLYLVSTIKSIFNFSKIDTLFSYKYLYKYSCKNVFYCINLRHDVVLSTAALFLFCLYLMSTIKSYFNS